MYVDETDARNREHGLGQDPTVGRDDPQVHIRMGQLVEEGRVAKALGLTDRNPLGESKRLDRALAQALTASSWPIGLGDHKRHAVARREKRPQRRHREARRAEKDDPERHARIPLQPRLRARPDEPLPFVVPLQLLDLAKDQIALDAAQPIDEDAAVEMIHFVLKRAREQPVALDEAKLAVAIETLDDSSLRAGDRRCEAGHAEAAFILELHAFALDEHGVDEHLQILRLATDRHVHHEDPQRRADLRRCEADPRGRIHRGNHVVDERLDVVGEVSDVGARAVQHGSTVFDNGADHASRDQAAPALSRLGAVAALYNEVFAGLLRAPCSSLCKDAPLLTHDVRVERP